MKQVCLWATLRGSATCCPPCLTLHLVQRNGFHIHGVQTGEQKCSTKPFTINLAVYLIGRLVNAQLLKHSRKLFVTDATPHHLDFYQFLRGLFPSFVRLRCLPTPLWRSFHHSPSAFKWPLFNLCRHFPITFSSRIRPTQNSPSYMALTRLFFENHLPTRSLHPTPLTQHGNVEFLAEHEAPQLSSFGGLN